MDFDAQPRDYDGAYQTGINTFAQQGVATANSLATDPQEHDLDYPYVGYTSKLYAIAFFLLAAVIFGLPLFY
jgi:hypothetical protein